MIFTCIVYNLKKHFNRITCFIPWLNTSSLHKQILIKYERAKWPLFSQFLYILNQGQEIYNCCLAVDKQWVSWHSYVTSYFMWSRPFLWDTWWVLCLLSLCIKVHKAIITNMKTPFACLLFGFQQQNNKKFPTTFLLLLCYMYAN